MKHNRILSIICIIGLAALIIMLTLFSPTEIGPLGVLLFFTTVYVVLFSFFSLLIAAFRKIALNRSTKLRKKDYLYAAVAAFAPIMLLLACSFDAINLWVLFLIIIFVTLAEFLVYKRI